MPFIPHTKQNVQEMLTSMGVTNIGQLFDEIPKQLPKAKLENIPPGISEQAISRLMVERAPHYQPGACFIGAGAYEHYIPAAVWEIATRGEFYTAYTPYQAEASQGSLQLIYEYQSMMSALMSMDVANASLYDGASALAEAILMALRIKRSRSKRVLIPATLNPAFRKVLTTMLKYQEIVLEEIPYHPKTGQIEFSQLQQMNMDGLAAIVIAQPNFFGVLEEVDQLTDFAHKQGGLVIGVVNPIAMALLKPPGDWGENGVDIVCGEGQPLGVPLASGGPYFGLMCCRKKLVRQLPGRIVGRTEDAKGRVGYTLTLQAREQHIRRAKATSNICTNQGLMVTAATIYLSLLGSAGLRDVAVASHHNARLLCEKLCSIQGVELVFNAPYFHEFVIRLPKATEGVQEELVKFGIQAGYTLKHVFPQLGECLLVCATETKTEQDLLRYQQLLDKVLIKVNR